MAVVMEGLATFTLCVFIILSFCGDVLSNINQHVDQETKETFVSFQKNNIHECGGARVKKQLVVITMCCEYKINKPHDRIDVVIPAMPEGRREGYEIDSFKYVKDTVVSLVILKLPENEKSEDVVVIPLLEGVFDDQLGAGVIAWDEPANNYKVEPVNQFACNDCYIQVYDNIWPDSDSFETEFHGALLLQNKQLVGIATAGQAEPVKFLFFNNLSRMDEAAKINGAIRHESNILQSK